MAGCLKQLNRKAADRTLVHARNLCDLRCTGPEDDWYLRSVSGRAANIGSIHTAHAIHGIHFHHILHTSAFLGESNNRSNVGYFSVWHAFNRKLIIL